MRIFIEIILFYFASVYMEWWEKVNILNCYISILKWVYSDKLDIAKNCGPWDYYFVLRKNFECMVNMFDQAYAFL